MEKSLQKNMSYILQFIDSARVLAASLSTPFNNLAEEIPKNTCIYGDDDKK